MSRAYASRQENCHSWGNVMQFISYEMVCCTAWSLRNKPMKDVANIMLLFDF